ncbi:MAG: DNA recombination protein RmuC [Bacteroidales bacterium]|nr:DNA recombination protein RmuC [Bacteroidales bacterium]
MDYTLYIIIGAISLVILLVLVALIAHHIGKGKVEARLAIANKEKEMLGQQLEEWKAASSRILTEVKAEGERRLAEAKAEAKEEQAAMRERFQSQMKVLHDMQEQQLAALNDQVQNATRRLLEERQEELERGNSRQMDALLTPLREKLAEMKKAFEESQESNHRNSAAFETQMKAMLDGSIRLGTEAQRLTEALLGNGKVQGDWGEQLLVRILENSGLREGQEYEVQGNVKDEEGNNLRPDVVVHCSDGRNIVIDSKVSLTGYYNYVNAANEEDRQQAARDNLASVKTHVKELADKNYSKLVPNAVPTVLMFIPNEGSYILAMQKDQNLANEAFRKGVLLINPTNLMLALTLIYQLWKIEHREEDDKRIVEAATVLYEKFCVFAETFERIGVQLQTTQKSYDIAKSQLNEGRGNIIKRLDALQNMGVSSGKKIPAKMREDPPIPPA